MKKLSLILLLTLGSQSSLFATHEDVSSWGDWIKNASSSLKNEIATRFSGGTSYVKDTAHAVATKTTTLFKDQAQNIAEKAVSVKDAISTKYSGEISYIKDHAQNIAEKAATLIKDNPKASIACGVALTAGAAYLLYRKYKTKKTPPRYFLPRNDRPDGETVEEYVKSIAPCIIA